MVKKIIKREGHLVDFDPSKIRRAIELGFLEAGERLSSEDMGKLCVEICHTLDCSSEIPTVEDIQDLVVGTLFSKGYTKVAEEYSSYRERRSKERLYRNDVISEIKHIATINVEDSDIMRDNANIDTNTPMGVMLKFGSTAAKGHNDVNVLTRKQNNAHHGGDIWIHDYDFYTLTSTCCQIGMKELLSRGYSTGHGYVRPPNHIESYGALCCIAVQSNQNDQHGGQSVSDFDYAMADGVRLTVKEELLNNVQAYLDYTNIQDAANPRKFVNINGELSYGSAEDMINRYLKNNGITIRKGLEPDEKVLNGVLEFLGDYIPTKARKLIVEKVMTSVNRRTYKTMVAVVHNLNTMHSRAGAQVPFSSLNYGMDTTPAGRMAIKNILLSTKAGLGKGETPIFPIQVFRVKDGVSGKPGDPNYDLFLLACEVSAKRLFPNFSFLDAPFNAKFYKGTPETEIAYMGCRTRVIDNVYDPSKCQVVGRGNLSYTSINLPRLAVFSRGDLKYFFTSLDKIMDLVFEQLLNRFEFLKCKTKKSFPFLLGQDIWLDSEKLDIDEPAENVFKHGTLSVGFIGLAETLMSLIGKHHGMSEEAQLLGLKIIGHMRDRCDKQSRETGLNFTLLATPAEGLSGKFVSMDKKIFGVLEGVTDKEFYTNSFHIPVEYDITAYDKIRLEAPYHALTNAGHVSYIELDGDPSQNIEVFVKLVQLMKEFGMGYAAINHPVDRDSVCGHTGIIGDVCPRCGRHEKDGLSFDRIRRITGYLVGTLDRFNNAKRAEERARKPHGLPLEK